MVSKKVRIWSFIGFILLGAFIGVVLTSQLEWTPDVQCSEKNLPILGSEAVVPKSLQGSHEQSDIFVKVSEEILPTVVNIATTKIVERSSQVSPFAPLLRDFFGKEFNFEEPQTQRLQGLGSGIIVSDQGHILTNHHVIQNADDIKVTLYNKKEFEAELVGTDPLTEIAVIKIEAGDLPVARLGDSDRIRVGEWVLAFGNPLYLTSTVTAGIVSAKGRSIGIIRDPNAGEGGSYAIENFIQTDAAINPGNSGGALVNLKAEVIGVNTAIASQTGGYQGYGFAVPINLAKRIMKDLIEKGHVVRAWLGIGMRPVTEEIAERYGLDRPKGVLIDQIMDNSPAQKAGFKPLDIILKVEGKSIKQANEVQSIIALKKPGDEIDITILRDDKQKEIQVTLGEREREKVTSSKEESDITKLGLQVKNLNDAIRSRLRHNAYDDVEGIIVTQVKRYSSAAEAGIQPGDLITKIEEHYITSISDYKNALKSFDPGDVVIFYMRRVGQKYHAFVKIPE
ncbi:MAG: Do family serine endopeptidase [bacterium]